MLLLLFSCFKLKFNLIRGHLQIHKFQQEEEMLASSSFFNIKVNICGKQDVSGRHQGLWENMMRILLFSDIT